MTPSHPENDRREAVARCDCGADIGPDDVLEPGACDACSTRRIFIEAEAHRNPAPPPIPVRARYYLIECENCGWVGSSEQCWTDSGFDDSDVVCPVCCHSMLGDGPDEADTAKHGQAVLDRIASAEAERDGCAQLAGEAMAEATTLRAEAERVKAENTRLTAQLAGAVEALKQCRAELATLHHGGCDMEHAQKHSAGLRMANAALAALSPNPKDPTHG